MYNHICKFFSRSVGSVAYDSIHENTIFNHHLHTSSSMFTVEIIAMEKTVSHQHHTSFMIYRDSERSNNVIKLPITFLCLKHLKYFISNSQGVGIIQSFEGC